MLRCGARRPPGLVAVLALAFVPSLTVVPAFAQVATEAPATPVAPVATEVAAVEPAPPGMLKVAVHLLNWPYPSSGGAFSAEEMLFASDSGLYVMRGVRLEDVGQWFALHHPNPNRGPGESATAGNAWKTVEATVSPTGETVIDVPWPQDAPAYYLEEQGPNLFRRVELADKQGYSVTLRRDAAAPGNMEVVLVQKSFVPTGYNDTINSYVGRPTLVKTLRTATAPLKAGMATVLLWTDPGSRWHGLTEAAARSVQKRMGVWAVSLPGGREVEATVSMMGRVQIPNPSAEGGPAEFVEAGLGTGGELSVEYLGPNGRTWRLAGRLNEDGTGAGKVQPAQGGPALDWTATRKANYIPAGGVAGGGGFGGGGFGGGGFGGGGYGGGAGDDVRAVAIVLTAPADLAAAAGPGALPPDEGGAVKQVEVEGHLCTLDRDSEEWQSIIAADDAGARLAELIAAGKVKPLSSPRLAITDGERGTIEQATEVGYFVRDRQTRELTAQKVEVPFELAVTPRVLEGGQIRLTVECRLGTLVGWVAAGPLETELPIVAYQKLTAHITTRDGQPAIIRGLCDFGPLPTAVESGSLTETVWETLLLLAPRVIGE